MTGSFHSFPSNGRQARLPFIYLCTAWEDLLLKIKQAREEGAASVVGHVPTQEAPRTPTPGLELDECHWMFLFR